MFQLPNQSPTYNEIVMNALNSLEKANDDLMNLASMIQMNALKIQEIAGEILNGENKANYIANQHALFEDLNTSAQMLTSDPEIKALAPEIHIFKFDSGATTDIEQTILKYLKDQGYGGLE